MGNISNTAWAIPGSDGQPIYGNTHVGPHGSGKSRGALICCHGFKGYKDYGFFKPLCLYACAQGLVAHRFNFSHSGVTHRYDMFERPELFERDRWGRQVEDLGRVIEHVTENDRGPIVIFGHSRGGVTSTIYCGNKATQPIAGLVTAAAPDYACKLDDLQKDQLRTEGRLLSPSGRTGQDLYIGLDWLEEIEQDPQAFDPVLAAGKAECPMLIIHGSRDQTVPLDCAQRLHRAATPRGRLEIINHASHTFNCPNPIPNKTPYAGLPYATRRMIELAVEFAVACCEPSIPKDA
ncbi:MAG: alpha/beta fold hydrolase [Planctomycetota bacterium]